MKYTGVGQLKIKVQRRIVFFSFVLLGFKAMAFAVTNSVGVMTDAFESIVNVTAGMVSLLCLRISARPPDSKHPYGKGKIEFISASLEGLMIMFAGGYIIYEGINRLMNPVMIGRLDVGIFIIALSGFVNYLLGSYSIRTGKKYDSIALIAGGRHLHSDTWSTAGLILGLIVIRMTGLIWIDSVLAFFFGGMIIFTGISILRNTIAYLTDRSDNKIIAKITDNIPMDMTDKWVKLTDIRTRRYGDTYHMDGVMTLPRNNTIEMASGSIEYLMQSVREATGLQLDFSIATEPCVKEDCPLCGIDCPSRYRKSRPRLRSVKV